MKLYDSKLKNEQGVVAHANGSPLRMYTCGPTVYNYAHIGNFRSYLFADSIYRGLKYTGHEVDWVMNLTDVDDKTIRDTIKEYGAEATVLDLRKFTDKYIDIFLEELTQVNIDAKAIRIIRVADVIPQIQEFITQLLDKGYAYQTDDGTYFSIEKYQTDFGDYGELVGQSFLQGKKVGARVKVDDYEKENLSDFALWKKHTSEDAQIFWDHPQLGKGRPGWHIECSVINNTAFEGKSTDIHTGGVDLIFPHHTNEIAQSQPFYKPFTKLWAHCEHLQVDNKKMAKRDGNFYTLKDLTDRHPLNALAFRFLCLQTDFRKTTNFTLDSLDAARNRLLKVKEQVRGLQENRRSLVAEEDNVEKQDIIDAINNDLNLPVATALICQIPRGKIDGDEFKATKIAALKELQEIIGIDLFTANPAAEIPQEIRELVSARNEARTNKDFAKSDELRTQIESAGYEVLDTQAGTQLKLK